MITDTLLAPDQTTNDGGRGCFSVEAAAGAIADWTCPAAEVRNDIIRQVFRALCGGIEIEASIPPGPAIFLGNHQTTIDLVLFSLATSTLRGEPMSVVGWDGMLNSHAGAIMERMSDRPEPDGPVWNRHVFPRMIDTRFPEVIAALAGDLGRDLSTGKSVAIVANGHRQRSDSEAITQIAAAFFELALAADVPVYPYRLMWGLPEEPAAHSFTWSPSLAPQRYVIGPAILPDELRGKTLKGRRERILESINALWRPVPAGHRDTNFEMNARVNAITAMTGMDQTKAMLCDLLISAAPERLSDEGRRVRLFLTDYEAAKSYREEDWLYRFVLWLSDGLSTTHLPLSKLYPDLAKPENHNRLLHA